jgi:hypothetical protein
LGTPLRVGTSQRHFDTFDSPRPGLKGSHHLPPCSIICSSPPKLHPNGSFSWDSQGGVLKLSQVGVPGLWEFISPDCNFRLERGLNQNCSSLQELSNSMLHSFWIRQEEVDSRLLVVKNQTEVKLAIWLLALLLPITWAVDVQMAYARPFWTSTLHYLSNDIKNTQMWGDLTLQSNFEFSGVPEDSNLTLLGVWVSSSHLSQSGVATLSLVQNQVKFKKLHKLVFNEATMATNCPDLKQIQLVFNPFHESLHFLLYKILSFNNNVCSMKKLSTNFN